MLGSLTHVKEVVMHHTHKHTHTHTHTHTHIHTHTQSGDASTSAKDEPVLVRGNLQKLGKRFKGWHQRYFEIQGSHMYYYKNASVSSG